MKHKAGRSALVALIAAGSIALGAGASIGAPVTVNATIARTWSPLTRTVVKGGKVVWKNPSGERHNIHAYGGNWSFGKQLESGDSVARRFKKTGTYNYRCKLHSEKVAGEWTGMIGKIKVTRP